MTLLAVSLAVTAGYNPLLVYVMLVTGSLLGGTAAWSFGRTLPADPQHGPRILRGPRFQRALAVVRARFEKQGRWLLVGHRFIPVLRGLAFLGAGASRVPWHDVLIFGGLGAALFNGALFALGYLAGDHWEAVVTGIEHYSLTAAVVVVVGFVVWLVVRKLRARPAA